MRWQAVVSFGILMTVLLCNTVHGWDGKREGFVLAVGVGPGYAYHHEDGASDAFWNDTDSENKSAALTNFKIGCSPTNQTMILLSHVNTTYKSDLNFWNRRVEAAVTSLSIHYYTRPNAPSFLFGGGFGQSSWTEGRCYAGSEEGFGVCLEAGYEYSPHFNLTLHLLFGKPIDERTSASMGISLNFVGY